MSSVPPPPPDGAREPFDPTGSSPYPSESSGRSEEPVTGSDETLGDGTTTPESSPAPEAPAPESSDPEASAPESPDGGDQSPGSTAAGDATPPPAAPYPGYGSAPTMSPGYATGAQAEHPQGTTVLVLGILGLVCCTILAPVAWYMGQKTLNEIDASPTTYTNRQTVNIGRILGIIGTVLLVLVAVFYLFIGVLAVGASST